MAGTALAPALASGEDVVLRWNRIAAHTATATTPFNQARVGAIVQLAVFEAVNAVTGDYEPYLQPGMVAPAGTSVEAAVVVAAHDTLVAYFPAAAAALDASRDSDLANIPDSQAKTDGIVRRRPDRSRRHVHDFHPDALLPQLPVEPRQRDVQRPRGAAPPVRRGGP